VKIAEETTATVGMGAGAADNAVRDSGPWPIGREADDGQ
jgi:hypothetical protein